MLIADAELNGSVIDVRCERGMIVEMGGQLAAKDGESVLQAGGGALLPGLHDHHIHLYAQAVAETSVLCGPPDVNDRAGLAAALRQPSGSGWLRGVGYYESVAGDLERRQLDQWLSERPLRIQHRSGKMWMVNSLAAELLSLDTGCGCAQPGIERDTRGRATGRLFRMDSWLRDRLGPQSAPDLAPLSRRLASWGVTGVTDAGATNSAAQMQQFCRHAEEGTLLQRLLLMGDEILPLSSHPEVERGALKILLDDHRLPDYQQLIALIDAGHRQGRAVAIHCVTPTELVFALTALLECGSQPGDRIEHASVTPDDALPLLQRAAVTVVTQPGFICQRGDRYRQDVEPAERPLLYRCQSFLNAGIALAGGSDAPYGSPDPWLAMRAAVARRTRQGHILGAAEKLTPERALALFTGAADRPGSAPRPIEVGAVADLCLLDRPWRQARTRLDCADVQATLRAGELIYHRTGFSGQA